IGLGAPSRSHGEVGSGFVELASGNYRISARTVIAVAACYGGEICPNSHNVITAATNDRISGGHVIKFSGKNAAAGRVGFNIVQESPSDCGVIRPVPNDQILPSSNGRGNRSLLDLIEIPATNRRGRAVGLDDVPITAADCG